MDTVLIYSATKSLCSFSHVKLCTEVQLWCHFLYQLQCRWLSWAESLNHSKYNTCSTITCGDMACWSCVPGSTKELTSHSPWKPFHIPRKLTLRYFPVVTSSPVQPLFSSMQSVSCSEYSFLVLQCIVLHLVILYFTWRDPAYSAILTANRGFPDLCVTCQFYQPWLFIYCNMVDANFK